MRTIAVVLFSVFSHIASSQNVTFNINTGAERRSISPLIYGINYTTDVPVTNATENYRSFRLGGNRLTGYNWENNASNAGSDYIHNSDNYLCSILNLTSAQCSDPAAVLRKLHETANGQYSLVTLPTAGYVAADKNGPVSSGETAPSARWKEIRHLKGSAFTLTPDVNDGYVFSDEAVNFLVSRLGSAANGGIKGYCLDNEPALWPSTHPRIHPQQTGAAEVANKNIELANAIKSVDPTAETFGGVFYGFSAYYSMQSAPDWNQVKGSYNWYIDYFLDRFKTASATSGKRLLDVLDLHWYPEAVGSVRITGSTATSRQDKLARMQAPRTLWDSTYRESSWIASSFSSYLPLIPRLNASINQYYPGTKLSVSEYNYGGGNDISGGIAQADVLGIFGKLGVYSAQMWTLNTSNNYFRTAFRMFNNYNGNNRGFGNTSVASTTSDIGNTSVYAAIDGDNDSTVHLIVVNKSSSAVNGTFNLNSVYNVASAYRFDSISTDITKLSDLNFNSNFFTYQLSPVSVTHFVLRKLTPLPLRLISVTAAYSNTSVRLQWKVEGEFNIKSYQVQRSCNGTEFTDIGNLPSVNSADKTYSFTDLGYTACNAKTVYYRIRTNEADGSNSFSRTISVLTSKDRTGMSLYPNPASGVLHISGLKPLKGTIRIIDAAAKVVSEAVLAGAPAGTSVSKVLDIQRLQKGSYQLLVHYSNGEKDNVGFLKD